MRRAAIAAAVLVAACSESPEAVSVENRADMLARDLEAQADNMEALADATANAATEAALENAADGLDEAADNVRDSAEDVAANL
jgi:hypothetical protein